jgi:hypothetical protein
MPAPERHQGWGWFEDLRPAAEPDIDLCRAFLACFQGPQGELALRHLRRVFLDRRLPPSATDAELRHVEGQRSVVAYIGALVERARDPQQDRF